ncbi:hypothetical protein [Halosimplex marinum]|uniref:hypothetical protein n=1 Tax=Halosimplex marinum TaxID=3396620 RepID=UPI003F56C417
MARKLVPETQYGSRSSKKRVSEGDLLDATLQAQNEITVYEDKVPADKAYHWGYGFSNREAGETSFVYADFQNSTPAAISGQLVLAITDSTQEDVLAKRYFQSLEDLRAAESDARSERIVMSEMQPAASEDRHLELRIVADSSSDGDTVSPGDSSVKLNYGTVNV